MYFALDDQQQAMADAVSAYVTNRFNLDAVRRTMADTEGDGIPTDLWAAMSEQGWFAALVPEAFGGLGLGMIEAQLIGRAFGAGLLPGPWRSTVLVGEALRLAGSDELQEEWLEPIASGEKRGAIGLDLGLAGSVEYAAAADLMVLVDADGLRLVEAGASGASITPLAQYDATVRLDRVTLDRGAIPPVPCSRPMIDELRRRAAVLAAAELVGIAREALRRTVQYAIERVQFGAPIGSFQAIKHGLADLHVGTTMAEHAVLYAAHALDAESGEAALVSAIAKAKASDVAKAVTAAMIQYHGGIGFTWEGDAHLFYKRAKRLAALHGDAAYHRERIARLTIDRLEPETAQTNVEARTWEFSTNA